MSALIWQEFRKIILNRAVLFFVIIMMLLNMFKIYFDYKEYLGDTDNQSIEHAYRKLVHEVSGKITEDKILEIKNQYLELSKKFDSGHDSFSTEYKENTLTGYEFGDMGLFERIYSELEYAYKYKETNQKMVEHAKANIEYYAQIGNIDEKKTVK